MELNSRGLSTILYAQTQFGGPGGGVSLQATAGPIGQFGYFVVSSGTNEPGINLGSGRFCLGSPFGRYNIGSGELNGTGQFDGNGEFKGLFSSAPNGFGFGVPNTLPFSGSPIIASGSTWHFQLWHRENGGDSNFSNGLSLTF